MKTQCQYHPAQPAHFECHECRTTFCSGCISKRTFDYYGTKKTMYFCPKCNVEAVSLGVGNIVDPFWKRLPQFFVYPFKIQPLILILLVSGISTLFAGSVLINLVLGIVMMKYALVTLNNTAQGNLTAPDISPKMLNEDIGMVFKQVGILVCVFFGAGMASASFGPFAGIIVWLAAILCIPAMIMTLVATDSMVAALNPVLIFQIIFRIGGAYFLMYFFLMLLMGAPALLANKLYPILPPLVHYFIFFAAKQYYTIMTYNLMGYVLLQYHEEIGYDVEYENFVGQAGPADQKQGQYGYLLNEVNIHIQDGRIDEAITAIQRDISGPIQDLELADKYYGLLRMQKRRKDMLDQGSAYLNLLVDKKKKEKACEVYKELLALDPEFTPDAESLFRIGEWLASSRNAKDAVRTLVKFTKLYPDHTSLPDVYFSLAKIFHTRLNNSSKAKEILNYLLKKYPDHSIIGTAKNYMEQMA